MGRWLVILSLALGQCPGIVAASPQSQEIPLPKAKPSRHDHQSAPAAPAQAMKAVATPPSPSPWPAAQSGDASAEPSQIRRSRQAPVRESAALSLPETASVQSPGTPLKSRRADNCSEGRRIVSAYYWEGQRTASGERFNPRGMTAAHRTLPFGTRLTVSNPRTGKSVTVVINDRGPFVSGVGLDLSLGAAQALGMRSTGAVCVTTGTTVSDGKG
jgi:rare lipoprotein A